MTEFEKPVEIPVPLTLIWDEDGDKETVSLVSEKYPQGKLTLYTSNEPLSRNSRLGDLNRIDIIGEINTPNEIVESESFFYTLKTEHVYEYRYETRAEAIQSVFEYIEMFYNRQRRHSALGYRSPVSFELEAMAA